MKQRITLVPGNVNFTCNEAFCDLVIGDMRVGSAYAKPTKEEIKEIQTILKQAVARAEKKLNNPKKK